MPAWLTELVQWWEPLPPDWKFLMLLPFIVAAAAFLSEFAHRQESHGADAGKDAAADRRRHVPH